MAAQKKPDQSKNKSSGGFDMNQYIQKAKDFSEKAVKTATPYAKKVISGGVTLTKSGFSALSKAWNNAMGAKNEKDKKKGDKK